MTRLLTDRPGATSLALQGKRQGSAALWFEEDIAAGEAVPGATDNDTGSWRAYLRDGVAANREAVARALARLAAFGDAIDPNGFSAVTSAQAAAGYAFDVVHDAPAASAYIPGNQVQTIENAPSGALSVAVRTPQGVDARAVVIDHRRGQNLVATYPRSSDDWDFLTQADGSPHYSYWKLVDAGSGSTIGVSGVQAGDTFDMRVHDATAFEEFIVDQLPDVAGREEGNVVILRSYDRGRNPTLYELRREVANYYQGYVATSRYVSSSREVRLTNNPDGVVHVIEWEQTSSGQGFAVFLNRNNYSPETLPGTLYVEVTHYSEDGSEPDVSDALSDADRMATRVAITRDAQDDLVGTYVYEDEVPATVIAAWRTYVPGSRVRFRIYTDSAYSSDLVTSITGHWQEIAFSYEEGVALQRAVADAVIAFDTLPSPEDFSVGRVVFVEGDHYKRTEHVDHAVTFDAATKEFNGTFRGAIIPDFGTSAQPRTGKFEHNLIVSGAPYVGGIYTFIPYVGNDREMNVVVLRSAYDAAKGSSIAAGDDVTVEVTDGTNTATVTLRYLTPRQSNRATYDQFQKAITDTSASDWVAFKRVLDSNSLITAQLWAGTSKTDARRIKGASLAGWTRDDDLTMADDIDAVSKEVEDLRENTARDVSELRDKTSRVTFDESPVWQNVPAAESGDYGRFFITLVGDQAAAYQGQRWSVGQGRELFERGGNTRNVGILWVLPNNITWHSYRLSCYDRNDTLKWRKLAQDLRDAPGTVTVAGVPASPPDHTVRWTATSDTDPYSVGTLGDGDVVRMEKLASAHVPRWEGELSESVEQRLRDVERAVPGSAYLIDNAGGTGNVPRLWRARNRFDSNRLDRQPTPNAVATGGRIGGIVFHPKSHAVYVTDWDEGGMNGRQNVANDHGLQIMDIETGARTRVGSAVQYGIASLFPTPARNWRFSPGPIAIKSDGSEAAMAAWLERTNDGEDPGVALSDRTEYALVMTLNLETGAVIALLHSQVITAIPSSVYRGLTYGPGDEALYACTHGELYTIATNTRTKVSGTAIADHASVTLAAIGHDPHRGEIVGYGSDDRFYYWDSAGLIFRRYQSAAGRPAATLGSEFMAMTIRI